MPRTRGTPRASSHDNDAKAFVNESDILHPVDKRWPDDDWPTFPLYNATVYGKDFATLENLLMVQKKGPFPMRGRMVVDYDDESQVSALRSSRTPRRLDVELLAYRMSIGYDVDPDLDDDDTPVPAVWAATDYGFFRVLRATPEYQPILNKMFEAITLYYTVIDVYEKHEKKVGKKGRALAVDEVLFRYAVDIGEAIVLSDAIARCREHAEFLASHFDKDSEFNWAGKEFASYIRALAIDPTLRPPKTETPLPPSIFPLPVSLPQRSRSAAKEGAATPTPPHGRMTRHSSSAPAKSQSPSLAAPAPKSIQQSSRPAAQSPPRSGELRSEATARRLYDAIIDANSTDPISNITIGSITSKIYFRYKFTAYKGAAEAMKYYAQELVRLMGEDSERAGQWRASRLYNELASIDHPIEPHELQLVTPAKIESSLVQRKSQPRQPGKKDPHGEKPAKTPTAGKTTLETPARRGRPSGKTGGLRLTASVPTKRFRGENDSDANGRATKSSKQFHHMLDYDEDDFGEESGSESEESITASDGEPDQAEVRLAIDIEDGPSMKPSETDGAWVCDQEGCGHVVDGADGADGRVAVREHLHEHEETSEKVKLAITEGHATGNRHIEHLLEKLKKIGGRDLSTPDFGGPQPIKREHELLF